MVAHDDRGLRLWISHGCPLAVTLTDDGLGLRDMPFSEWITRSTVLTHTRWRGPNVLMLLPPRAAHSVWWFWDRSGGFASWYVNLEEPGVCWRDGEVGGVDTCDQDLDIWVYPDRTWEWKDEDELEERLAFPDHYWVRDEAALRAEGTRVIELAEAGLFPFDGTWCDWRPDPTWRVADALPAGWDRPRVPRSA